MRKFNRLLLALSFTATYACVTAAQTSLSGASVPKVLQVTREFIKPGKAGMAHDKSENAFVEKRWRVPSGPRTLHCYDFTFGEAARPLSHVV